MYSMKMFASVNILSACKHICVLSMYVCTCACTSMYAFRFLNICVCVYHRHDTFMYLNVFAWV